MYVSLQPKFQQDQVREDLVALRDPQSSRAADLRRVAQTLALRWFDGSPDRAALTIISADRYEGRSTVAANIACIFAQAGMSVLLIDADLEQPALHRKFQLHPAQAPGGAGYRVEGLSNLCVVPASEIEEQEPGHFMHKPVRALIERKRGDFGAIFVDTAAAAASNDYLVAALASGGALVVTREGVTRARSAARMLNSCQDVGIPIVGGVMLKS